MLFRKATEKNLPTRSIVGETSGIPCMRKYNQATTAAETAWQKFRKMNCLKYFGGADGSRGSTYPVVDTFSWQMPHDMKAK
jgi:hypothetical protein